jgi:hypothetical protein
MRWRFKRDDQRLGWATRQFESETHLQGAIDLILRASGVSMLREPEGFRGKSRADFWIKGAEAVYIEAKVETKSTSFDRALGQALRYAVCDHGRTWIVIPDDVRVTQGHIQALESIGGDIIRISDLAARVELLKTDEKVGFRYLDQEAAFRHMPLNSDPLKRREIKKAVKKRFPGITPCQKQKQAEESKRACEFMAALLNAGTSEPLFYVGEHGLTVKRTERVKAVEGV